MCDFVAQNTPKCVCGQTPLGELTVLPQTSYLVFRGLHRGKGWEGRGRQSTGEKEGSKGEKGVKARGVSVPSLFYNLTTATTTTFIFYAPAPRVGALSDDARLMSI